MEIPKAEEIKESLNEILTRVAQSQNIENFEINLETDGNYGDGFVGQFYEGEIRDKNTGEVTMVAIKKAPTWDFDYNTIFKNELLFYEMAYPVLNDLQTEAGVFEPFDNVVKYYCGSLELKEEYLTMENLKPLGYVMHDKKEYLDREHLETLFKVYGKFHAISYVLRQKDLEKFQNITKDFADLLSVIVKYVETVMVSAVCAAVTALDSEKDQIIYGEIKDLGDNVVENYLKSCKYTGKHRVLAHGDCWSNNMLFKYSESGRLLDIKLIDFQMCTDTSPILDLSYFFYSGASKQDFDNLDSYLQIYHKTFVEFTKELGANTDDILSFEELKTEWKENALFGVIMGIYLWQVKLVSKNEITDAMSGKNDNQEKVSSVEDSWKQFVALQQKVHSDEKFIERTTAILRHAFEYGVVSRDTIIRKTD